MYLFTKQYKMHLVAISLYLTLALTQGCGYHFRTGDKTIGQGIKSLAIPLIQSTSSSLGFEGDFTTVIRQEFARRSKVPLVPREDAGAVLIAKVYEINTRPVSYNTTLTTVDGDKTKYSVTSKRQLKIRLDAKLIDRASGKPVWQDKSMAEKATFDVTADPLTNRYNQRKAVQKMARRFAERIYLKTMDRF